MANFTINQAPQSPNIWGFTLTDFAAVAALIISAFTFYFGFSRTRKSEQIKIVRELTDRVVVGFRKLIEVPLPDSRLKIIIIIDDMNNVLVDIRQFIYLVKSGEIHNKNILRFYIPIISGAFIPVEGRIGDLKKIVAPEDQDINSSLDDVRRNLNTIRDSMTDLGKQLIEKQPKK